MKLTEARLTKSERATLELLDRELHTTLVAERYGDIDEFDRDEATCTNCGETIVRSERSGDSTKSSYSTWRHVNSARLFDCEGAEPREEVAP